jgi:salicylate synthetase
VRNILPTIAVSPAETAVALVEAGLFDTYLVYERDGVWTVAGGTHTTVTLDATRVRMRGREVDRSWPCRGNPLGLLGDALAELSVPEWTVYGWIAFETAHLVNGRPDLAGDAVLAHLVVPEAEVRVDADQVTVTCADEALRARVDDALARVRPTVPTGTVAVDVDRDARWYQATVADAVRRIQAGEFEKVVLSRSVPVEPAIDLPRTYLAARAANTPARSFLLDLGGVRAAGFCPETLIESDGTRVSTQPLAGTRSFGNGADRDLVLRRELCDDPKEIHEHVMSVRLACAELARVGAPDSVVITELMSVKQRGSVQHLGSRVSCELGAGMSAWHALEAVFPAVTASGIPKEPACAYIARHEQGPRGLYAGVVLTASHDGSLDAGLVLRTVFEQDGWRWLRAGAGIVGSSRPAREYEETCEKLRSVAPHLVVRPGENPLVGGG